MTATADGRKFAPGFWRLWTATTVSGLGDGVRIMALSLFAAALTRDPFLVALVTVAGRLPWVCVGPLAGALVDRIDRWRALWLCDVARAVVLTVFVALSALGQVTIAVLAATAFALSSVQAMADNLSQAVVRDVVGPGSLDTANSRLLGGQFITVEFIGVPMGTALFLVSPTLPFALNASSFLLSAVLVFGLRGYGQQPSGAADGLSLRALRTGTASGFRRLFGHPLLRTLCLMAGLLNFALVSVIGIVVLYAFEVLHLSSTEYSVMLVVVALGGLAGVLLAPRITRALGRGTSLQVAFGICPLPFAISGGTSNALLSASAFAVVGASISVANVTSTTLRQTLIPPEMFGSVNGAYRSVVNGLSPLGGLAGGIFADRLGLRAPFFIAAGLLLVAACIALPRLTNAHIAAAEKSAADDRLRAHGPAQGQ
ncbi:MFS transporter [Streptomyces albicerus]|uniref:MFS transporter n=1 Tax=Streptomyces albicerus TaxID=2569859 RepID=UPI00124BA179|nr:MFS transporter [Streptomyces albicerus]